MVPAAVEMLLDDELSLRVAYHADENMMFMNPEAVSAELRRQSAPNTNSTKTKSRCRSG